MKKASDLLVLGLRLIDVEEEIQSDLDFFEGDSFADREAKAWLNDLKKEFERNEIYNDFQSTFDVLRETAIRDPLSESQQIAFENFIRMRREIAGDVCSFLTQVEACVGKETAEIEEFAFHTDPDQAETGEIAFTAQDEKIIKVVARRILDKGGMVAKRIVEKGTPVEEVIKMKQEKGWDFDEEIFDFLTDKDGNYLYWYDYGFEPYDEKFETFIEKNKNRFFVERCGYSCFTKDGELVSLGDIDYIEKPKTNTITTKPDRTA